MHKKTFIKRRKSTRIYVGNIPIGNNAPIAVQTMTKTRTTDIKETIKQINKLKNCGADIIRISVPTMNAAKSFKEIKKQVKIPIIADVHFNHKIALKVIEYGADCLRINPGNIGNEKRIKKIIDYAKEKNIPIRIGVNSGSLEKKIKKKYGNQITPEALVESVMRNVDILDKSNYLNFKVSIKSSNVLLTIQSYRLLSSKIDQPLHIGITEAGGKETGQIKSAVGLGILLSEGIGDTIRVSLTSDPKQEIIAAYKILQSLNIRSRGINFISCPGCSRQEFDVINIVKNLENKLKDIITPIDVSIIGCIVNGPGEAELSSIGIVGSKTKSSFYENGIRQKERFDNKNLVEQLEKKIRIKIENIKNKKK